MPLTGGEDIVAGYWTYWGLRAGLSPWIVTQMRLRQQPGWLIPGSSHFICGSAESAKCLLRRALRELTECFSTWACLLPKLTLFTGDLVFAPMGRSTCE